MDFTFDTFKRILSVFLNNNYKFQTFENYIQNPINDKVVILRHDIDKNPKNAALFALIENQSNIKGSFYFRIVSNSNKPEYIRQIQEMGHEIGYHYEDLTLNKGRYEPAYLSFQKNLEYFRQFYPVKTICMHGSPLSRYDNRNLWKNYSYYDLGVIGEPYFNINFNDVFYLTDTGRRWDGENVSVRDKIEQEWKFKTKNNSHPNGITPEKIKDLKFHSSFDIINAVENGNFPDKVMMTFHPQRWNDNWIFWTKELFSQKIKNYIKWSIINLRRS